jgi:hypothetical protein
MIYNNYHYLELCVIIHAWLLLVGCLMPLSTIYRSVLLVEKTGVLVENHWPVANHWQTLSHNVVSSTSKEEWRDSSFYRCNIQFCSPFHNLFLTIVLTFSLKITLRQFLSPFHKDYLTANFNLTTKITLTIKILPLLLIN